MAKSVLLSVLSEVLGKYVENLSSENLELGVWSGTVELFNVKLKKSALDDLNLPIVVERATLKSLKLTIPWASLSSKPVTIDIDGVLVQAFPLDPDSVTSHKAREMLLASKKKRLGDAERPIIESLQTEQDVEEITKKATYIQQLTTMIIDNLEVNLTNIHIRYEDSVSVPNNPFACGVTIERISLATTDESWTPGFVTRDAANKANTSVHKLGTMEGLGIYWNSADCQLSQRKSFEEWVAYMHSLIKFGVDVRQKHQVGSRTGTTSVRAGEHQQIGLRAEAYKINKSGQMELMSYILSPANHVEVRVVHREKSTEQSPKVDVTMLSSTLPFLITDKQYMQIMLAVASFSSLERRLVLITFRPAARPTEQPRAWWHYAYKLVTGRHSSTLNKIRAVVHCRQSKKEYIHFFRRRIVKQQVLTGLCKDVKQPSHAEFQTKLSAEDAAELPESIQATEANIPLTALVLFRQTAAREAVLKVKKLREDKELMTQYCLEQGWPDPHKPAATGASAASGSSSSSWWWWGSGGSSGGGGNDADGNDPLSSSAVAVASGAQARRSRVLSEADYEDDERLMAQLEAKWKEFSAEAETIAESHQVFAVRATVATSASVDIYLDNAALVSVVMGAKTSAEVRGKSFRAILELQEVTVRDCITPNPVCPFLVTALKSLKLKGGPSTQQGQHSHSEAASIQIPFLKIDSSGMSTSSSAGATDATAKCAPSAPLCSMLFETKSGRVVLHLTARPLQLAVNERCINGLLRCFTAPLPAQANSHRAVIKNSPLLAESMSKFSSEMALPTGYTDVELEIFAPKIVIPETCSKDNGCLVLDLGKLRVSGEMGPKGMQWNAKLLDTNVDMPHSMEGMYSAATASNKPAHLSDSSAASSSSSLSTTIAVSDNASSYVVPHFDVAAVLTTAEKKEADMILRVQVLTPHLGARLDALKLVRLKNFLEVVLRAVQVPQQAPKNVGSSRGEGGRGGGEGDVPRSSAADTTLAASAARRSSVVETADAVEEAMTTQVQASETARVNAVRQRMAISIIVPSVGMTLAISNEHYAELKYSGIDFKMVNRAFDMNIFLKVGDVTLSDSLRPASHRAVVWTDRSQAPRSPAGVSLPSSVTSGTAGNASPGPVRAAPSSTGSPGQQLLNVHFRSITNPLSPLYDGNELELTVVCAGLGLSIDAASTERYAPFVTQLLAHFKRYNSMSAPAAPAAAAAAAAAAATTSTHCATTATHTKAQPLQAQAMTATAAAARDPPTTTAVVGGKCIICSVGKISLVMLQDSVNDSYESAFQVEMSEVFAQLKVASDSQSLEAHLNSFDVKDLRQSSTSFFYRTLICSRCVRACGSSDDGVRGALRDAGDSEVCFSDRHLLQLSLHQSKQEHLTLVEAKLCDFTAFLSLDVLTALVQQTTSNVDAVMSILKAARNDAVIMELAAQGQENVRVLLERGAAQLMLQSNEDFEGAGPVIKAGKESQVERMVCDVCIENPQVLLVEDPASQGTRAIAAYCRVDANFTRETTTTTQSSRTGSGSAAVVEVCDELVATVKDAELLVVASMNDASQLHKIVEPVTLEARLSQVSEGAVELSKTVNLSATRLNARVSLNDILLVQRVMAKLQKPGSSQGLEGSSLPPPSQQGASSSSPAQGVHLQRWDSTKVVPSSNTSGATTPSTVSHDPPQSLCVMEIACNFEDVRLTLVNDTNDQHIPLVEVNIGGSRMSASGAIHSIVGSGGCSVHASYFNLAVCEWEPILEPWKPTFSLRKDHNGTQLELSALETLQINLTGAFFKCLYSTISLLEKLQKSNRSGTRRTVSPLQIHNSLGLPVKVFDSDSHVLLVTLSGDEVADVPLVSVQDEHGVSLRKTPSALDIYLDGDMAGRRQPIQRAPATVSRGRKLRSLSFHPSTALLTRMSSQHLVSGEPIVEEVFEFERYNMLTGSWGEPWVHVGDPPHWTTASGESLPRGPKSMTLPKHWYWVETSWVVDKSGRKIGVEIDKDGWEYGSKFSRLLEGVRQPRCQRSTDQARRRKFVRTRAPQLQTDSSEQRPADQVAVEVEEPDSLRALPISWHVQARSDESKLIEMWSGLRVVNRLPFPLEVMMLQNESKSGNTGDAGVLTLLGDTAAGVPVLLANRRKLAIRPKGDGANGMFLWSESIKCKLPAEEEPSAVVDVRRIDCARKGSTSPSLHFTICTEINHKTVTITFSACLEIFNWLPTSIALAQGSQAQANFKAAPSVAPGAGRVLPDIPIVADSTCSLTLAVGQYVGVVDVTLPAAVLRRKRDQSMSAAAHEGERVVILKRARSTRDGQSPPRAITKQPSRSRNRDDDSDGDDEAEYMKDVIAVTLRSSMCQRTGTLQLFVFSRFILVDRSDSALVIKTSNSSISRIVQVRREPVRKISRRCVSVECDDGFAASIADDLFSLPDNEFESCWASGKGGVTLFHSGPDDHVSLGVNGGSSWLRRFPLKSLSAGKNAVEIADDSIDKVYHLALSLSQLPGVLGDTQQLTVMPRFTIVNYMDENLDVVQNMSGVDSHECSMNIALTVAPKKGTAWHGGTSKNSSTVVQFRLPSTEISIASVDLNEVGTTVLALPRKAGDDQNGELTVITVEVALAPPDVASYITVIVWRSQIKSRPDGGVDASTVGLSVKNRTDMWFLIRQDGLKRSLSSKGAGYGKRLQLLVPPGEWLPFGLADPAAGATVHIAAASPDGNREAEQHATVDILKAENCTTTIIGTVAVQVESQGNGRVLRLFDKSSRQTTSSSQRQSHSRPRALSDLDDSAAPAGFDTSSLRANDLILKLNLACVSVSVLPDIPVRREFLTVYWDGIQASYRQVSASRYENAQSMTEVKVAGMQVDNHSESALFPVLLRSESSLVSTNATKRASISGASSTSSASSREKQHALERSEASAEPFFHFVVAREYPKNETSPPIVKYFAVRMLEVKVAVDSSTIILYFCDLHGDLTNTCSGRSSDVSVQDNMHSMDVVQDFNCKTLGLLRTESGDFVVNPHAAYDNALKQKVFYENFAIHPIKLSVTYEVSVFPRDMKAELSQMPPGQHWVSSLQHVTAIEGLSIGLNSFIIHNALETRSSLIDRIMAKTQRELRNHLVQLAGNVFGSLSMFGNPAGLYKKIGTGVTDMFYEPYMGIMESPQAFVLGLGKGTKSLVSGVAGGFVCSAATIVSGATGSVAGGVAALSGDEKYIQERQRRQREQRMGEGGVLSGLKAGGKGLMSGFTSGITGLVTTPMEHGKKDGALGFLRGVGMGTVGVAVKPLVGVADGVTSVVQGIAGSSAGSGAASTGAKRRSARVLQSDDEDPSRLLLEPVDLFATVAQSFVVKRAAKVDGVLDRYLASTTLGFSPSTGSEKQSSAVYGLVVSSLFVTLLSKKYDSLFAIPFTDISHVILRREPSRAWIEIALYHTVGHAGSKEVPCATEPDAVRVYGVLASHAQRMGNPAAVVQLDSLSRGASEKAKTSNSSTADHLSAGKASENSPTQATSASLQQDSSSSMNEAYAFGSANGGELSRKPARSSQMITWAQEVLETVPFSPYSAASLEQSPTESQHNKKANANASLPRLKYFELLDKIVWELVAGWRHNHNIVLNPSRCSAILIINNSPTFVQILETELQEGAGVVTLGVGKGYDADSRTLYNNGGAAVVFAYGARPSLLDLAHVALKLSTSAFSATVSSQKHASSIRSSEGYQSGFQEKSRGEFWAKTVICID